jgi:hypothetical protein
MRYLWPERGFCFTCDDSGDGNATTRPLAPLMA